MRAQTPIGVPGFEEFWRSYPRREKRRAAEDAFRWAMQNHNSDGLLLSRMLSTLDWQRKNGLMVKYWPMPDKWLLGERWTDEPPEEESRTSHAEMAEAERQREAARAAWDARKRRA